MPTPRESAVSRKPSQENERMAEIHLYSARISPLACGLFYWAVGQSYRVLRLEPHGKDTYMFWRRKSGGAAPFVQPDELPSRSSLASFAGDLSVFRSDHWVPLKVWLPEPLDGVLRQLGDHGFASRSALIRDALFIYAYGQYVYAQMKAEREGFFYDKGPLYSRVVNRTPELGKNLINYKVWLPAKLREDMQTLADLTGTKLSHFVREVLIASFMGHLRLPEREALLVQALEQPDDWPPEEEGAPTE